MQIFASIDSFVFRAFGIHPLSNYILFTSDSPICLWMYTFDISKQLKIKYGCLTYIRKVLALLTIKTVLVFRYATENFEYIS